MAAGMERQQNKRSAASYYIDPATRGLELRRAGAATTKAKPVQAYAAVHSKFLQTDRQQEGSKKALQALSRLLGREVTQTEGRAIVRDRGRGQQL